MGHSYSIRSCVKGFTMGCSIELALEAEARYLYYLTNLIIALIIWQALFLVIYKYWFI